MHTLSMTELACSENNTLCLERRILASATAFIIQPCTLQGHKKLSSQPSASAKTSAKTSTTLPHYVTPGGLGQSSRAALGKQSRHNSRCTLCACARHTHSRAHCCKKKNPCRHCPYPPLPPKSRAPPPNPRHLFNAFISTNSRQLSQLQKQPQASHLRRES